MDNMEPRVSLGRDQDGEYNCPCEGVDTYHVSAHCIPWGYGAVLAREAYAPGLGTEYLSGAPSSVIMWRRSLRARLVRRASEEGEFDISSRPLVIMMKGLWMIGSTCSRQRRIKSMI